MIDPKMHVEMCDAEFAAGKASRDAEIESLRQQLAVSQEQVMLLRDVLKTIYEDFDCDKNAHDYGTDCRCCIAEKALAATEPKP